MLHIICYFIVYTLHSTCPSIYYTMSIIIIKTKTSLISIYSIHYAYILSHFFVFFCFR